MTNWQQRLSLLSQYARSTSPDPKCPVAAALYTPHGTFMHADCNRLPHGLTGTQAQWLDIEWKLRNVLHAEQACLHSYLHDVRGWTMLVTKHPCHDCAKHLIQRGIARLICPPYRQQSKWVESHEWAREMMREAGIKITEIIQK